MSRHRTRSQAGRSPAQKAGAPQTRSKTGRLPVQKAGASRGWRAGRRGYWLLLALATVLVLGGALGGWLFGSAFGGAADQYAIGGSGGVMGCRGLPAFSERLGYKDRLGISTSERTSIGLAIFDARVSLSAAPEQRALHQEPSWDDAGTLGPFVLDRAGNIYTAPVPRTAISDNPPHSQNTIYRVDSVSGELAPFLTLPDAPTTSAENPFGILGLTYDCESDALYVSSVGGSTRRDERGRIVRVDLATKAVTEEVVGVDAIGLGVYRGAGGKRLYLGMARESALASVVLDASGHATGDIRDELKLADVGAGIGEPKVRRIGFDQQAMTLYIVPFNFNLRAVSEQQQIVVYYGYDAARDSWVRSPSPGS